VSDVTLGVERHGDRLRQGGDITGAVAAYQEALQDKPDGRILVKLARAHFDQGALEEALRCVLAVVGAGDDYRSWQSAAALLPRLSTGPERRPIRGALLGSFTTAHLAPLVELAARASGLTIDLYEGGYGQYRQELLNPTSELYARDPEVVILAVHEGELGLPPFVDAADAVAVVESELANWTTYWEAIGEHSSARIVQYNFALTAPAPFGHLTTTLPGSRHAMAQALNLRLGAAAAGRVGIVDCERLASSIGKERWFSARQWHSAKQAVALEVLPVLARHTAAVVGAQFGISRKCVVLDLDNTLWGGIVGEDGLSGLKLGGGAVGEAFVAFQRYLLQLKERGILLAVCSKNNDRDAREVFERHPEMVLRLEDIAFFLASWDPKPEQVRRVARELNLGLDALVFVDDNPVEAEAVRQLTPDVSVVQLPSDPADYVQTLAALPLFETASFTLEDAERTAQYQARSDAMRLEAAAGSVEDFLASLEMEATLAEFDDVDMPRIAQLVGKTNQFNVTTRRHSRATLASFRSDPAVVTMSARLRDRFADHGLIAVLVAEQQRDSLVIDTWLMSCRVIGRNLEHAMLNELARLARIRGCTTIRGTYIRSARNQPVADLYPRLGFSPENHGALEEEDETESTSWVLELGDGPPVIPPSIEITTSG
jgi:FkbH-like protein